MCFEWIVTSWSLWRGAEPSRLRLHLADLCDDLVNGADNGPRRLQGDPVPAIGHDDVTTATRPLGQLSLEFSPPTLNRTRLGGVDGRQFALGQHDERQFIQPTC